MEHRPTVSGTPSRKLRVAGPRTQLLASPLAESDAGGRGRSAGFQHNAADPLLRRTRSRPDHNRVRDVPSPVSVLGLAPPPP